MGLISRPYFHWHPHPIKLAPSLLTLPPSPLVLIQESMKFQPGHSSYWPPHAVTPHTLIYWSSTSAWGAPTTGPFDLLPGGHRTRAAPGIISGSCSQTCSPRWLVSGLSGYAPLIVSFKYVMGNVWAIIGWAVWGSYFSVHNFMPLS